MNRIAGAIVFSALVCPTNCYEYKGDCACDAPVHSAKDTYQPSDEKPRKSQQPEWETGEVKAIQVPNLAAQDAEWDREKAKADLEGKQAAGLQ